MNEWIDNIIEKQPALTEKDKALRDAFVDQYILDNDPVNAVIRLGYNLSYAKHMAEQFMLDSYVLNLIQSKKLEPVLIDEKRKSWISNELMSRAQYQGPGASETAKILALRTLMELHGLAGPSKPKPVKNAAPGGVMIVPQYKDAEEWEKTAITSQKNLMSNAT